ncbi:hypothetical protein [Aquibacillus rhizosphaerae]|uniref:Uncharacterized protein n=1 Tax=Aquibacillus rhizosphaerae TaxID=3051431 RepID=A0ABT7LAE2_9BACI|nr:hypothetical protein [Aquibacillus sp. LR5S19]MDL4842374.1 hypothetical protein [Aquibacillus sp. LR5S19]
MKRYLFEYEVISSGLISQFSIVSASESEAKAQIKERVADIEFTEESDITIKNLIKTIDATDNYYECEGCT